MKRISMMLNRASSHSVTHQLQCRQLLSVMKLHSYRRGARQNPAQGGDVIVAQPQLLQLREALQRLQVLDPVRSQLQQR